MLCLLYRYYDSKKELWWELTRFEKLIISMARKLNEKLFARAWTAFCLKLSPTMYCQHRFLYGTFVAKNNTNCQLKIAIRPLTSPFRPLFWNFKSREALYYQTIIKSEIACLYLYHWWHAFITSASVELFFLSYRHEM